MFTNLKHQRMWCVHEVWNIAFGRRLQAELAIRRHRIVHEHYGWR